VRNIAVDRSSLKDDRHSAEDAEQLYKDVEKLRKDLQSAPEIPEENEVVAAPSKNEEKKREEVRYSGPSVLSWELEGRKASRLPIPAYRCLGAGEVRINITVDKQGNVTGAKVDEGSSSSDGCLRSFAVRAARMSKFSMSSTAPDRQQGFIIYQFVAQ
jgi:TonB family protein